MLTTEAFASTQWCPYGRIGDEQTTWNRDYTGKGSAASMCLGSACMAWRWVEPAPVKLNPSEYWPKGAEWNAEDLTPLLGQPEPPRPSEVPAEAIWVPLTLDGEDNWQGGCWRETREYIDALNQAAQERRRGYCGAFGKVDHE